MSSVPMNQHQRFQVYLRELCEGAAHAGQSEFCFPFSLDPIPSNAGKVWPLCSNLLILRTLQFSQICAGNMLFSCLEAKVGNKHYLSQNIAWSTGCQICQTCSATLLCTLNKIQVCCFNHGVVAEETESVGVIRDTRQPKRHAVTLIILQHLSCMLI